MDSTSIFVVVALLGISGVCGNEKPDMVILPPGPILLGTTLTIECTVPVSNPLDMSKIVRSVEGQDYTITTKGKVEEYFGNTGRYSILSFDARAGKVVLQISDVTGADGGNIQCMHVNTGNVASQNVVIDVPVKSVEILYFGDGETKSLAEDGQTITLQENREGGFECSVEIEGSDYDPEITMLIDGIDITYECTRQPHVTSINRDGLLEVTNVVTVTYRRDSHDEDYNGKKLTCRAKMPEYDPQETSAKIEVQYAPKLVCSMAKFKLGEKNVQLMCQGKMHPPPMFSAWLWGKKPNRTMMNTGDKHPGFHASEENLGNDKYKFTLDIDEVTSDLFTKFKLEVENNVDVTEESIRLTREEVVTPAPTTLPKPTTNSNPTKGDGKSEADTGVASRRTASVWTLIMSVATIVGATMLSLSTS